jgi:lipooligosaccharide transport system permease protein
MIAAVRMVQRNALVYRRIWRGTVFLSFLQPTLFLIAMGLGLGTMIDAGGALLPGGVRYAEFLAPGLLASTAMQAASFESAWPVMGKMMWHRNYEAIMATPMSVSDVVFGELGWIAIRLTTIGMAFVLVMTAFGIPRSPLVILAIPSAVLTGLAFAAPIIAFSATLTDANPFNLLFRFVITPLFMFSGVFVPVSRLPEPVARAAWFTPLFHGVELVRGFTLGAVPPAWPIHVTYLIAMIALGAAVARTTFRRRLYA